MVKKFLSLVIVVLFAMLMGCSDSRNGAEVEESAVEEDVTNKILKTADEREIQTEEISLEAKETGDTTEAETENFSQTETVKKEEQTELYDWQVEFTEEMVQSLPDVPDWNSSNAYISFLEGYKPSSEVLEVYRQKEKEDKLFAGYLDIYYKGEEINYMPPYEEELYSQAMFKQNDELVTAGQSNRKIIIN